MEPYRTLQYIPLLENRIRLLDLQESRFDNNILSEFRFITAPLTSAPEYEALSYCWGSTELCTGVLVSTTDYDIQVCRLTEDLATCLHSLIISDRPDQKRPAYLWVDQICINQDDISERDA